MRILFICTHNRCRSILSEAICNHLSNGQIEARSAGSQPADQVHPLTLKYLQEHEIPTEGLHSQSWDEFENFDPELIVTVCDKAANEVCPVWFGQSTQVHWGLYDPSKVEGTEEKVAGAFNETIEEIKERTAQLTRWIEKGLSPVEISGKLA